MIKMINDETGREDCLTSLELSKVVDCVLMQMERYNSMLASCLNDDSDVRLSIEKARHELYCAINSLNEVCGSGE